MKHTTDRYLGLSLKERQNIAQNIIKQAQTRLMEMEANAVIDGRNPDEDSAIPDYRKNIDSLRALYTKELGVPAPESS